MTPAQAMITPLKPTQPTPKNLIHQSALMRAVYFVLGLVCLILGLIGIVVPGMPRRFLFYWRAIFGQEAHGDFMRGYWHIDYLGR